MSFTISFNVDIAKKAGVDEAIVHAWILTQCYVLKAQNDEEALFEDEWWVRCPKGMLENVFPFWTEFQIGRILSNLNTKGLIKTRQGKGRDLLFTAISQKMSIANKKAKKKIKEIPSTVKESDKVEYIRKNAEGEKETIVTTTGKLVNEMIDQFKHVNPSFDIFFSRKVHRRALENMIERYPINELFNLLMILPKTNGIKYAPTITSPLEFERLAPKLIAFVQKKHAEMKEEESSLVL